MLQKGVFLEGMIGQVDELHTYTHLIAPDPEVAIHMEATQFYSHERSQITMSTFFVCQSLHASLGLSPDVPVGMGSGEWSRAALV